MDLKGIAVLAIIAYGLVLVIWGIVLGVFIKKFKQSPKKSINRRTFLIWIIILLLLLPVSITAQLITNYKNGQRLDAMLDDLNNR